MLKHCPNIKGYHYCDCQEDCQVRKELTMTKRFKEETLLKIRREFTQKEKYNILMEDYFKMIKQLSHLNELQEKYDALREQHKNLQYKYTQLRNKYNKL